jgi:predicted permease
LQTFFHDVAYSFRSLQTAKGFTFISVLTLALAIAANTVVYSVVNATLLHPLPYRNPGRLVILSWYGRNGLMARGVSAAAVFELSRSARSFDALGVDYATDSGVNLSAGGAPQYARAQRVSRDFFRTLGVSPAKGRDFTPEEDQPGGPTAVILSYGLWRQNYNGNPEALGSEARINGESYKIVGVMPSEFRSFPEADLWLPLRLNAATAEPGNNYQVIARLKDTVSLEQARQELALNTEYQAAFPVRSLAGKVRLAPDELQSFLVSGIRQSLRSLLGAVLFVLLIGCTNLALLLTVRGATRAHELGVRAAMGANRIRLVRSSLMDGILISIAGGAIGAVLGKELLPLIPLLAPADLPLSIPLSIDWHVLLFIALISVTTIILSGLIPALRMSRVNLSDIIRQSPRATGRSPRESTLGRLLVLVQTGLTMFLLTGAVTLLRNFLQLQAVPPGFDPRQVMVAQISLATPRYAGGAATRRLLNDLTGQIRSLPGVEGVASVSGLPLEQGLRIIMIPANAQDKTVFKEAYYRIVSPEYFQVLRMSRTAGRLFSEDDDSGSTPVAVISEGLARQWWPGESPLGRFVTTGEVVGSELSDVPRMVVGVVADVREAGLERPAPPAVFVPLKQAPDTILAFVNRWFPASIVVRAAARINLHDSISRALAGTDADLAVMSVRPLTQVLATSLARPRFQAALIGAFGSFALFLNAVGLYGLLRYQLTRRVTELALRVAVGAGRFSILALILKQGVGLVALGLVLGSIASFFLTKSLTTVIYNMPQPAFSSVFIAALLMVAIAVITSLVTAVRATVIEPMAVLRTE